MGSKSPCGAEQFLEACVAAHNKVQGKCCVKAVKCLRCCVVCELNVDPRTLYLLGLYTLAPPGKYS